MAAAAFLLAGCSRVTREMQADRETGISLLESGDYEGAVQIFESLIENAGRVSEFELDVLKYRAEAEFGLEDFEAAAYTYDILAQVDGPKAEYCYFGALSLANAGDTEGAAAKLEEGEALDPDGEKAGYLEAVAALAEALEENGDQGGAEALYESLITAGKASTEIYNRLMMVKMAAGEYEEALLACAEGKALADGAAKMQLSFNEAVCYEYLGQYEEALRLFEAYVAEYGSDEAAEHEIAFLVTR